MNNVSVESIPVDLLICLNCQEDKLRKKSDSLVCEHCNTAYKKENGKIFFTDNYFDVDNWEVKSPEFDMFKRRSSNQRRIDKIGGPRIKDLKSYLGVDGVVLNLGSGKDNYEGHVNIDLGRYPNVHIISDLQKIPYKDESVDLLVSNSVLEHIYDYNAVVKEIYRVLKPGGYIYLSVPNLCMRHHEFDFHRWTMPGLLQLLTQFKIVESGTCRGVAYSLESLIEALIVIKTKPGLFRELLRRMWLWASTPLFRISVENSPEYQAMSQTIYVIAKK